MDFFKAYDIRGIYSKDIDEKTAYFIGIAFSRYLKEDLKENSDLKVIVGMDMRHSSPNLKKGLIKGLNSQNVTVLDIGLVPTPAFYHAVSSNGVPGGIMITASHNPKEFNGFKVCGRNASPIGMDSGLEKVKEYFGEFLNEDIQKSNGGRIQHLKDAVSDYVKKELSYLDISKIKKFKIVADPANSMGALELDELFSNIPCEVIKINWKLDGDMPAHEANPIKYETLKELQETIVREKADFGIATDGDGDRIVFLDEKGDVIPPHMVLGLIAQELLKENPGAKIGYDLRSSKVVKEMIEEAGGTAIETRVGHSFIKKLMDEEDVLFSGELSSHYYYKKNFNAESPIFTASMLLLIRSVENKPFSEIWKKHQKYFQSGEQNFKVSDKDRILNELEKKYSDGEINKIDGLKISFEDWWFSVRSSNTEPLLRLNLEADTEKLMNEKLEEVKNIIFS